MTVVKCRRVSCRYNRNKKCMVLAIEVNEHGECETDNDKKEESEDGPDKKNRQ